MAWIVLLVPCPESNSGPETKQANRPPAPPRSSCGLANQRVNDAPPQKSARPPGGNPRGGRGPKPNRSQMCERPVRRSPLRDELGVNESGLAGDNLAERSASHRRGCRREERDVGDAIGV